MITRGDDFPFHQTAEPIAFPGTSDPNFYDRYFFHGYQRDASLFFAIAFGIYPNRRLMDAAVTVVYEGDQRILHASRTLIGGERFPLAVGPIRIGIVRPLETLEIEITDNEYGIAGHLRFEAIAPPIEEPRFQRRTGPRLWMDYTRLTQHGAWRGELVAAEKRFALEPQSFLGARDRSWGVRPLGQPEGGLPVTKPQFFWLWAPLHWGSYCLHFSVSEESDGQRWHEAAFVLQPGKAEESMTSESARTQVNYTLAFEPGTRWIHSAQLSFDPSTTTGRIDLELQTRLRCFMAGLGYGQPVWGHGRYQGENVIGGEVWQAASMDPKIPMFLHVQNLCEVRGNGIVGVGVLEQLILGPHAPSGFSDLLDVAP